MPPKKSKYKSKKKLLAGAAPFEIQRVQLVSECYVDKENLRAFGTVVFIGSFKTEEDNAWTISILPENFQQMCRHSDVEKIFTGVGLSQYFSLPPWGTDVKRAYQLLSTLDEDGNATIEGHDGAMRQVLIDEEMVSNALKLPRGKHSLVSRSIVEETQATFSLVPGQEYTFRDMVQKEAELPLRLYTQHFKHGKAIWYTKTNRRVATFFSKVTTSRHGLSLNFAELTLTELKSFARRKRAPNMQHMNYALALTRIAYFEVGMMDELPSVQTFDNYMQVCLPSQEIAVKGKKKERKADL